MIEITPVEIVNLINNRSPRGSFSVFVKLNETIGVKLTRNMAVRDANYTRQTLAAEHGLGPKTYGIINSVTYKDVIYYGYFTEVAEMLDGYCNFYEENKRTLKEELFKQINFDFTDIKPDNCGVINGKMVCIDFDNVRHNLNMDEETELLW